MVFNSFHGSSIVLGAKSEKRAVEDDESYKFVSQHCGQEQGQPTFDGGEFQGRPELKPRIAGQSSAQLHR